MKRTWGLRILPFAWAMIGADGGGCDPWAGWSNPPPAAPPSEPYCYTDPPLGCAAVCMDVDVVGWTAPCSNVEAGPQTDAFEAKVQSLLDSANAQSVAVCTADNLGATLTPCMVGINPAEWPNQDHATCTTPPAGCPL
jgi:hypothetical protein